MKTRNISLLTFVITLLMLTTINVKAAGFNVTRTITGVANPVTNTFTYTVTADSSNPSTVTLPSTLTPKTIAFTNTAPSSGTATQTASPLIADTVWTGLNYSKPGTYKFVVSESASSNATLYPRDTKTYTVTIFVENNLNSSDNTPDGTFSATYIGSQEGGTGSKITSSQNATFTSAAGGRAYLQITKQVTGNAADVTTCFQMTITLSGYINSEVYNISGSSCPTGTNNATSATMPSSGTTAQTIKVQVKHNDTVVIGRSGSIAQLPVGATYTIEETAVSGYTTYINGSSTAATSTGSKTVSATQSSNNYTFKNDSTVPTPTGIIIRTLPFVVLIVLSVVGVVAITRNKQT